MRKYDNYERCDRKQSYSIWRDGEKPQNLVIMITEQKEQGQKYISVQRQTWVKKA
jgi:hypothetical protein